MKSMQSIVWNPSQDGMESTQGVGWNQAAEGNIYGDAMRLRQFHTRKA